MLYQDVGQGKLEALAHCLAGVWGRFHTVVCGVCTCESRQEEKSVVEESGSHLEGEGAQGMERAVAHGKRTA